ncbi:MAG TPA: DUF2059 domain-containing protein [Beijerinckiaceae bacterium]|jgi:hypothetical protein
MIRISTRLPAAAFFLALTGAALAQGQAQYAPSHLAAGREVALIAGVGRTVDQLLPEFSETLRQITVTRPEVTKDLNEVLDGLKPEMEQRKQEVIEAAARSFAGRMSEPELRETLAFFNSGVGKKFSDVEPQVSTEVLAELGRWSQRTSEFVVTRVRTEMAKRGHQMQ